MAEGKDRESQSQPLTSSAESTPGSPDRETGKRQLKPTEKSKKKIQFDKDEVKETKPLVHPPLDFPLAVSQNSAKERSDKHEAKGTKIDVTEDDATKSGAFLSVIFTDKLREEERKGRDEDKWKKMKKLMECVIRRYPKSFNRLRDISKTYDVQHTYDILREGGIIHSTYKLEEQLVEPHGVFTEDGKNAFMEAVSSFAEMCSLSIATYSCGDLTFTIGYQCDHFFVVDTQPVGKEQGGNGNGLLKVFPTSNHSDETSKSLCNWVLERLKQKEVSENEEQSFILMAFVPSETPQDEHVQEARIKRIYFLSLTNNDSTKKSWKLLEKAEVELIPYPRGNDGLLQTKFRDTLTSRISRVHHRILEDLETKKGLNKYEELTKKDKIPQLLSKWQAENQEPISKLHLWEHWFMLIAMTASIKSTRPERPEGCLLVDAEEFKMCGMSYRGFPRGIENNDPDLEDFIEETEVSAITNAISLRFKEGSQYYCFATHFPDVNDAKYLAQAGVKHLVFICPAYTPPHIDGHALKIFKEAKITVEPMTDLHKGWLEEVSENITETVRKLDKKESGNPPFAWPTPDTVRGIVKTDENAPLTLVYPLILGGKRGLKPSR